MSTYVWCELVCDGCSCTTSGTFSSDDRIPRVAMKKDAKIAGWTFRKDESWCKDCTRDGTKDRLQVTP